jgi:hypothetical protein
MAKRCDRQCSHHLNASYVPSILALATGYQSLKLNMHGDMAHNLFPYIPYTCLILAEAVVFQQPVTNPHQHIAKILPSD